MRSCSANYWRTVGLIVVTFGAVGCQEILNFVSPEQLAELRKKAIPRNACQDDPREPGFVNIARLTNRQSRNTLRAITGYTDDFPGTYNYPSDSMDGGFSNSASAQTFDTIRANAVMAASEAISIRLAKTVAQGGIMTCSPTSPPYTTCADSILQPFMQKAWRRPPTAAELTKARTVVTNATTAGDTFTEALQLALQAVLVSPNFHYRMEFDPNPAVKQARSLTNSELASRLSYMIWNNVPDATLLAANLQDDTVLLTQLNRMIADAKASEFIDEFVANWLEYHNYLDVLQPSPSVFPTWNESYRGYFKTETSLFFKDVMSNNLPVHNLLDAQFTYANNALASLYGLPSPGTTNFVKVSTASSLRRGLLGQGSLLTASTPNRTSPVKRGRLAMIALMCTSIADPPPGVEGDPGSVIVGTTLRERLEAHRANPTCAACHDLMDPPGLAFENFDAIGRYRTVDESGNSVDASGTLLNGQSFANVADMAPLLGQDSEFRKCLVTKLFTYSLAHTLSKSDRCEVSDTVSYMTTVSGKDTIRGAMEAIVLSETFQMRTSEGAQ